MIIYTAEVTARGATSPGSVELTLIEQIDGWTYAVTGMASGQFTLPWRSPTPEEATRRLQESYSDPVWHLSVLDVGEEDT